MDWNETGFPLTICRGGGCSTTEHTFRCPTPFHRRLVPKSRIKAD